MWDFLKLKSLINKKMLDKVFSLLVQSQDKSNFSFSNEDL